MAAKMRTTGTLCLRFRNVYYCKVRRSGTSHFRFPIIWHGSLLSGGGDRRPFTDI